MSTKKCLILTLDTVVDNSELPLLDTFKIPVIKSSDVANTTYVIGGDGTEKVTVTTSDNTVLYASNGSILQQPYEIGNISASLKFGTQTVDSYSIFFKNAHCINRINFHDLPAFSIDWSKLDLGVLRYCNWDNLHLYNPGQRGIPKKYDLSEFTNIENAQTILCQNFNIVCTDITTLSRIKSSAVSCFIDIEGNAGSLESLISAWAANGVTNIEATLYFYFTGTVTYNGVALEHGNSNKYKITIVNGTATVTKNDQPL